MKKHKGLQSIIPRIATLFESFRTIKRFSFEAFIIYDFITPSPISDQLWSSSSKAKTRLHKLRHHPKL